MIPPGAGLPVDDLSGQDGSLFSRKVVSKDIFSSEALEELCSESVLDVRSLEMT